MKFKIRCNLHGINVLPHDDVSKLDFDLESPYMIIHKSQFYCRATETESCNEYWMLVLYGIRK